MIFRSSAHLWWISRPGIKSARVVYLDSAALFLLSSEISFEFLASIIQRFQSKPRCDQTRRCVKIDAAMTRSTPNDKHRYTFCQRHSPRDNNQSFPADWKLASLQKPPFSRLPRNFPISCDDLSLLRIYISILNTKHVTDGTYTS